MYFLAKSCEGLHLKDQDGKTVGKLNTSFEDELTALIALKNNEKDIKLFCEQVIFWHENFMYEGATDIQKTTSKILINLAQGVLNRL